LLFLFYVASSYSFFSVMYFSTLHSKKDCFHYLEQKSLRKNLV